MITIKLQNTDPSTLNNRVFDDKGRISTLIIFKPRTKSSDLTIKYREILREEVSIGDISLHSLGPNGEDHLQNITPHSISTRGANNWRRNLGYWIMTGNKELNLTRKMKFFSTVKDYHEVSSQKFRLYTDKIYSRYVSHLNLNTASRATSKYLIIKCKNMETYEILEKLSKNQKLIPNSDIYHFMYLLEKILIKTNTPISGTN